MDSLEKELSAELYKHLKEESKVYIEKIPNIWLQKFVLMGSIIAFLILQSDKLAGQPELTALGLVAIPLLAILLDIKVLEFSLHAHVISRFIDDNFGQPAILGKWERLFWSFEGEPGTLLLARVRSFATVAVAGLPTCIIILLSGIIIDRLKVWPLQVKLIGAILCAVYLVAIGIIAYLVWFRHRAQSSQKPE